MNSLEHAVVCGDHVMVKTLLDKGADPDIPGNNNEIPLHRAVNAGHHVIAKTLLTYGADPNLKDISGRTALHFAALEGHHAMVEPLLAIGADANLKDVNGCTPLQCAAGNRHRAVYDSLLPKTQQPDWNNLLQVFSRSGWKDQVEVALARGANPNIQDSDGDTPLGGAATAGHHAIVETLLDNGANPNIPDSGHYTPLHRAAAIGHHPMVETLLNRGADPNLKDGTGRKALTSGLNSDYPDVYRTLLPVTHQPDWNSLLPKLVYEGWKDQVEAALVNGADPNKPDFCHKTQLHRAAEAGHCDIVKTLLVNGADPKFKDWNGRTACQCAMTEAIKEAIQHFMAEPHSLQFYCRASIRGRLVKCLHDNGLPMKEAIRFLPLNPPAMQYVDRLLSL
ncbi:ankyrin repeat domain-containing protein [Endozoicomonas acroporae]|uniref:ankyrin repeat domain-containing protein n=1 Tax=Endozoicomonas acroporae TaxID=1701104 RepID=UPI003D7B5DFA